MQEWTFIIEKIYDDGQYFWFIEHDYNSLFRIDKKSWSVELIGIFPGEDFIQNRLYMSMVMCNGKLYFAPLFAKEIAEYDPEKKIFRKIPVNLPKKNRHLSLKYEKFFQVAAVESKLYFIPDRYPGILCYDTETNEMTCFDDWVDEIDRICVNEWCYFVEFELVDNQLILPCACADAVVIFNTNTGKSQIIKTPDTARLYKHCGICKIRDYFYLVSADGKVSKRKLESSDEEIKVIQLPTTDPEGIEFCPVRYLNEFIYLFPTKENCGYKIDTRTDQVSREEMFDDEKILKGKEFSFTTSLCSDGKLYAVTGNSHRFIQYDFKTESKKEIILVLSKEEQNYLEEKRKEDFIRKSSEKYMIEEKEDSLKFMLKVLQDSKDSFKKEDTRKDYEKGQKIYHTLVYG